MTMQSVCHERSKGRFMRFVRPTSIGILALCSTLWVFTEALSDPACNDYPTIARIEYVHECMAAHGSEYASMYQCACVIDRLATQLTYDEFLEASTFARYADLPGDTGAVFRDSDTGRKLTKRLKGMESEAYRSCGLPPAEE